MSDAKEATVAVLEGLTLKCPNCGDTEELWQNQMVLTMQHIEQLDGELEWGTSETLYEHSEVPKDEPEFFCRACDRYFEATEFSTRPVEVKKAV